MKTKTETRFLKAEITEVRGSEDPVISGYAAKFNTRSEDLGGFVEQIAPGAFKKTLKEADVRMLYNHEASKPMGRTSSGDLKLSEDNIGLRFELKPNLEISWVKDAVESIRSGIIKEMSFGFRTINDSWDRIDNTVLRTLIEVQLQEISPVTFPAYTDTSVSVRSYLEGIGIPDQKIKEVEARVSPAAVTPPEKSTEADTGNQKTESWRDELNEQRARLLKVI